MKANGNSQSESKTSTTRIQRGLEERGGWWERLLDRPLLWAVMTIAACTVLVLPRVGSGPPEWQPGEVAAFDFVMAFDVSLPDEVATESARGEARESVLPIYDLEPRLRIELRKSCTSSSPGAGGGPMPNRPFSV